MRCRRHTRYMRYIRHVRYTRYMRYIRYSLSVDLKADGSADRAFGWVLEMWGYSIACARHGIKHYVWQQFQTEPSSTWHQVGAPWVGR